MMAQGDITFIAKEVSLAALSFPYEVQKAWDLARRENGSIAAIAERTEAQGFPIAAPGLSRIALSSG